MEHINLESRLVGDISGEFFVAAYQRGYRWKEEVELLLKDINEIPGEQNYCLQPIVVKKLGENKYELIDGQQRLTTIYLIFSYMKQLNLPFQLNFSIEYDTRKESKAFLEAIDNDSLAKVPSNIDELFIIDAYKIITDWFEKQKDKALSAFNLYRKLNEHIHVVWYEIESTEQKAAVSLFTRLNIGRILLTNAELVKALFLSRNNGIDNTKQTEIATEWDIIEKELRNKRFWGFITNNNAADYPTRIELIFDLMANKKEGEREKLFTFFYFDKKIEDKTNKADVWTEIVRYYQQLKDWYEDTNLYHKIGYLIASNTKTTQDLIELSRAKKEDKTHFTKKEFKGQLDEIVANSIDFKEEYCDLRYDNKNHYPQIEKILLLFNVETIRQKKDETMFFPFDKHKNGDWSLEHIHAQESEGLNKKEQWIEWLELHKKSLKNIDYSSDETIIKDIEEAIQNNKVTADSFSALFNRITVLLSENNSMEYTHGLANLALLEIADNAALNNSTFDVKRNKILNMDKTSDYIPECTRRVFLKYYTSSDKNQLHFWGEEDRRGYMYAMNEVLKKYLGLIKKEIKL